MPDELQRRLLAGFRGESADLARKVTTALLELEHAPDKDALRSSFDRVARGLHTLKGSAATIGLQDLADCLASAHPGQKVALLVLRGKKTITLNATLTARRD